jgi:hypothetical protein
MAFDVVGLLNWEACFPQLMVFAVLLILCIHCSTSVYNPTVPLFRSAFDSHVGQLPDALSRPRLTPTPRWES